MYIQEKSGLSKVCLVKVSLTALLLMSSSAHAISSLSDPKPLQVAGILQEVNKLVSEIKNSSNPNNTNSTTNSSTNKTTSTTTAAPTPTPTVPTVSAVPTAPAVPAPPPAVVESAEMARRSAMKNTEQLITHCQKLTTMPKSDAEITFEIRKIQMKIDEIKSSMPNVTYSPSTLKIVKLNLKENEDRLKLFNDHLAERPALLKLCTPEKLEEIQAKRVEEAKILNVTPLPAAPAPGTVSSRVRQKAVKQ